MWQLAWLHCSRYIVLAVQRLLVASRHASLALLYDQAAASEASHIAQQHAQRVGVELAARVGSPNVRGSRHAVRRATVSTPSHVPASAAPSRRPKRVSDSGVPGAFPLHDPVPHRRLPEEAAWARRLAHEEDHAGGAAAAGVKPRGRRRRSSSVPSSDAPPSEGACHGCGCSSVVPVWSHDGRRPVRVKFRFNKDIRMMTISKTITMADLVKRLEEKFDITGVTLRWRDQDGDFITVLETEDLADCIKTCERHGQRLELHVRGSTSNRHAHDAAPRMVRAHSHLGHTRQRTSPISAQHARPLSATAAARRAAQRVKQSVGSAAHHRGDGSDGADGTDGAAPAVRPAKRFGAGFVVRKKPGDGGGRGGGDRGARGHAHGRGKRSKPAGLVLHGFAVSASGL